MGRPPKDGEPGGVARRSPMIGGQHLYVDLYASEACTARGWNWKAPSPVAQPRGSSADPPPPARPSRALACKQGVLGLRGEVGWWGEGSNPTPGPPLGFCPGAGPEARR